MKPPRPTKTAHRYERTGVLAIEPTAFLELFFCGPSVPENEELPEATVVTIRGPLDQHADGWCDSYESILERVAAACEAPAPAVLVKFDSPGGEAAGCIEAAREVRAMCERAGKQYVAYVEGKCASAAYAFASQASRVVMSDTALVGSIGMLATRADYSAQNAARGFRMGFVMSGARKGDGHPDSPITDAEVAAMQAIVDSMAATFFELVAEGRGLTVEQVTALQAGVFHGDAARTAGLGDETLTLRATLASLAGWKEGDSEMTVKLKAESGEDKDKNKKKEGEGGDEKPPFDDVRSRLTEMSKGDDANARAAARALKALDEDEEPEAETTEEKPEAATAAETAAASSTMTLDEVRKLAVAAEARAAKLEAKLAKKDEDVERERLIAQYPSLPKTMVALLQKSPLALVQETLKDFEPEAPAAAKPKGGASAAAALAALQPGAGGTRGESQTDGGASALPPAEKAALDRRFGLKDDNSPKAGNVDASSPIKLTLGGAVHKPIAKDAADKPAA